MLRNLTPIGQAFHDTDHAWQSELIRQFGRKAGDVRYTAAGKGTTGSKLRSLYEAYAVARTAWYAEHNLDCPA